MPDMHPALAGLVGMVVTLAVLALVLVVRWGIRTREQMAQLPGTVATPDMVRVVEALTLAGCSTIFLDGSFITAKPHPGDFDGVWDLDGVDPAKLDPVLLDFTNKRAAQKAKYFGEMFLIQLPDQPGLLPFFQKEKFSDAPKGIVRISLSPAQGATI